MFEAIEKLKQEYTDKYVEVATGIPELARFEGHVGQVKTVNMSGRALVQFDAWANIGWYDIDLDYLKVVPKPEPKAAAAKPAKAPAKPAVQAAPAAAGGKKLSPLEMARMQGAAKGAAKGTAKGTAEPNAEKKSPAPGAKAIKSTADILAAARAKKTDEAPTEPAARASAPTAPAADVEQAEPQQEAAAQEPQQAAAKGAAPALAKGQRPGIAEILAWCRAHDAK